MIPPWHTWGILFIQDGGQDGRRAYICLIFVTLKAENNFCVYMFQVFVITEYVFNVK